MGIIIKDSEKFSKILKISIATGAVALIVGGVAMVPVYESEDSATHNGYSTTNADRVSCTCLMPITGGAVIPNQKNVPASPNTTDLSDNNNTICEPPYTETYPVGAPVNA